MCEIDNKETVCCFVGHRDKSFADFRYTSAAFDTFALQTRDLFHIELAQSGNISRMSVAKAYRVNEVDISTKNGGAPNTKSKKVPTDFNGISRWSMRAKNGGTSFLDESHLKPQICRQIWLNIILFSPFLYPHFSAE